MAKSDFQPRTPEEKEFKKVFDSIDYSKNRYEVFCDFILMSAIAISQPFEYTDEKEKMYLDIAKKYPNEDLNKMAELLAVLVNAYTLGNGNIHFQDFLGSVYMCCGFGSSAQGQFFTPYNVCLMMAKVQGIPEDKERIVSVYDCCVGGGALIIAYAQHLQESGINYQKQMLAFAQDISINSFAMAYLQFSLLGIPAIVEHANAISQEVWKRWKTPMCFINFVPERYEVQKRKSLQEEKEIKIEKVDPEQIEKVIEEVKENISDSGIEAGPERQEVDFIEGVKTFIEEKQLCFEF